jgi:galactose mutarotase-like enzyme
VPLFDPSGLGWLEGFNELLCRCGLESNGAPDFDDAGRLLQPLHGRIANLPAHRVELEVDEDAGRLTLRGVVEETRFHFQSLRLTSSISTMLGSSEFAWTDEVENIGGRDSTLQMLYHFNIGQPLLRPGARISAPIATVAPWTQVAAREGVERWNIMPQPRPGSAEQGYLLDLLADDAGDTRVLVSSLTDNEAISLRFNKRTLPYFTVWRNTPAEIDGYVLGLEPATNIPNPRSFEKRHGRVVSLKPGETWRAEVAATWHTDEKTIAKEEATIRAIQGQRQSEILPRPRDDWSANT